MLLNDEKAGQEREMGNHGKVFVLLDIAMNIFIVIVVLNFVLFLDQCKIFQVSN